MLKVLFQKSYLRFVTIEKLSQWHFYELIHLQRSRNYCNNVEFSRTVAISLNPFFVEFRPKMRKSHSQDKSSPRFREDPHDWASGVTSCEDDIVRRSRDLHIELRALEITILPGPFADAFLAKRMGYSPKKHVNISIMIESSIFETIRQAAIYRVLHDYRNLIVLYENENMAYSKKLTILKYILIFFFFYNVDNIITVILILFIANVGQIIFITVSNNMKRFPKCCGK